MSQTGKELYELGWKYENGIDIKKDECKAFEYYQKSAEKDDADGIFHLGRCYQKGIGVKENNDKAFKCYMKLLSEMGNAKGAHNIAFCYLKGIGTKKDEKKALEYFMKSAKMGHLSGAFKVGDCYRNGIGTHRDLQRANHWYRKNPDLFSEVIKSSYENFHINDDIKQILNDERYRLSWIPYSEFRNIEEIGQGGFATVYKSNWILNRKGEQYSFSLALKIIKNSNSHTQEFAEELKLYCEIGYENPPFLQCHGISQHPESGEYIIVLRYAKKGSLRNNLRKVSQLKWKDKLNLLHCIASDLESIHSHELIHRDLHNGNILQDYLKSAYITDLGLTSTVNIENNTYIMGVMPYVAPEVLQGEPFTQAADIYSFGVIMTEVSTGQKTFDGESFGTSLAVKICHGLRRPECAPGTPDYYIKLAKRCMDKSPDKRPSAAFISGNIIHWLDELNQDDSEVKKQFLEADEFVSKLVDEQKQKHPDSYYTSKLINTHEITLRLAK